MKIATIYAALVTIPVIGVLLSAYIYQKKRGRKLAVCPLNFDCRAVMHSQYATFLGVPVEVLGMLYYSFVALSYLAFLVWPSLATGLMGLILLSLTTLAFLFSFYLTFVQIFAIRQLCSLCLTSALISGIILWLSFTAAQVDIIALLSQYQPIILILHVLGVILGVGGATLTDIFFFRFLKDLRISHAESEVLHTISQVIWFATGLLVLTGLALFMPESERLLQSSKFLAKVVIVAILIANGAALHYLVSPQLVRISFGIRHTHEEGELHRLRKLAYALGAVSIISWYTVFILGMVSSLPVSAGLILAVYLVALVIGIAVGHWMDERNAHKAA